jgi:hypothetical protein
MNAPKRRQPILEHGADLALFLSGRLFTKANKRRKKMPPEGGSER